MKINHNDILEFHKYFSKISHSKGRIRIRVSPKIRELRDSVSEESLKAKIAAIRGIKEYKFNSLIGSLTIHYDESVFSKKRRKFCSFIRWAQLNFKIKS